MIDLGAEQLQTVSAILAAKVPDCDVWAFGSRVNSHAQQYSDLDLALIGKEPIDWRRLEDLKDAFSESDLPITVDVVDWQAISESFRNIILNNYEVLRQAVSA